MAWREGNRNRWQPEKKPPLPTAAKLHIKLIPTKITKDKESYEAVIGEFGFTDAERPKGDLTTEQLCAGELPDAK